MSHIAPSVLAPEGSATRSLAEHCLGISMASLSAEDVAQIERLLLDHIGVATAGSGTGWAAGMREWAASYDGSGSAGVRGGSLGTSPLIAAFLNSTAAHGLELDDTHDESVSHPGAPVIAAALAVAEARGLGGHDLLPAIAAGYEVVGRIGAATGTGQLIERGFHPTALYTGFGVAATVAHLTRMPVEQLVSAWGLCLSMASGSMQFSQEEVGTTVKRLHAGIGALHGILSAELAAWGIDGPQQAFDGAYGLCNNFGSAPDIRRLQYTSGEPLEIHRVSFKPYPCCRLFHSTLDALAQASGGFSLAVEDIERIQVGGPAIMVSQHMIRRPGSVMAAQYSLPYTLAAAFFHGPSNVAGFSENAMLDSRILSLVDKVGAEVCPDMEAKFPHHFGSWVELHLRTGDTLRVDVLDSLGTPANPMKQAALLQKYSELTAASPDAVDAQTLLQAISQLRNNTPVADLLSLTPNHGKLRRTHDEVCPE